MAPAPVGRRGRRRRRHAGGFSSSKPPANRRRCRRRRRRWACRRIFSFKTPGKPPAGPAPAPAPRQKNFRILDIGILLPFLNQFQVYLGLETKLMIAKRVHHLFEGRRRTRRQKFLNTQNPRQNAGSAGGSAGDNIENPRRNAGAPGFRRRRNFHPKNPRQTAGDAGAGVGLAGGFYLSKPPANRRQRRRRGRRRLRRRNFGSKTPGKTPAKNRRGWAPGSAPTQIKTRPEYFVLYPIFTGYGTKFEKNNRLFY